MNDYTPGSRVARLSAQLNQNSTTFMLPLVVAVFAPVSMGAKGSPTPGWS